MLVYVISGNIGAGKSTVAAAAAAKLGALYVPEPVALWQATGALKLAYSHVEVFQPFALATRVFLFNKAVAEHAEATGSLPTIVITDRWLADDLAFAAVNLRPLDYDRYVEYWEVVAAMNPIEHITIRIAAPVEVCLSRLRERNRAEEACVTEAYLAAVEASLPEAHHTVSNVFVEQAVDDVVAIISS